MGSCDATEACKNASKTQAATIGDNQCDVNDACKAAF